MRSSTSTASLRSSARSEPVIDTEPCPLANRSRSITTALSAMFAASSPSTSFMPSSRCSAARRVPSMRPVTRGAPSVPASVSLACSAPSRRQASPASARVNASEGTDSSARPSSATAVSSVPADVQTSGARASARSVPIAPPRIDAFALIRPSATSIRASSACSPARSSSTPPPAAGTSMLRSPDSLKASMRARSSPRAPGAPATSMRAPRRSASGSSSLRPESATQGASQRSGTADRAPCSRS